MSPQKTQKDTKIIEEENLFRDECYLIQGAVFEVYSNLGCGFLEAIYQESLEHEFNLRHIPFAPQKELELRYKEIKLKQTYKPDFICYNKIIVELKALSDLSGDHEAQLLNYLKATNLRLGLLVNFGHYPKVQIKRMIT